MQGNSRVDVCLLCRSVVSDSGTPWMQPARLLCSWNFPGKNTGVACHFLLQWIFQTHGLNPHLLCLLHWQAGSLPLHHLGSPARLILANKYTQRTSPILCFSHSLFTIFTLIFKMSTRSSHNIILRQKKERGGLYYLYLFLFYLLIGL